MTSEQVKHWLANVAAARLAVAKIVPDAIEVEGVDSYEVKRTGEILEDAFTAGLDAHGQAVLREYLARDDDKVA